MLASDLLSSMAATGGYKPSAYMSWASSAPCISLSGANIQSVLCSLPMMEGMDDEKLAWLLGNFEFEVAAQGTVIVFWRDLHTTDEEIQEILGMTDAEYLRDLADRLFHAPVKYDSDQGDVDRLRSIATNLERKDG